MSLPDWWVDHVTETGIRLDPTTEAIIDLDNRIAAAAYTNELLQAHARCLDCDKPGIHVHTYAVNDDGTRGKVLR